MTGAARAKPAEALLPAEDCDLLSGRDAIARWFGLTCGQCDARIRDGSIVTFELPNRSTTYALKSENMRSWKAAAEPYRARERGRITLIFVAESLRVWLWTLLFLFRR